MIIIPAIRISAIAMATLRIIVFWLFNGYTCTLSVLPDMSTFFLQQLAPTSLPIAVNVRLLIIDTGLLFRFACSMKMGKAIIAPDFLYTNAAISQINSRCVLVTYFFDLLYSLLGLNECYKYKMDLTTNDVVITDAIKFVQTNKEKLTVSKEVHKDGDDSKTEENQEEQGLDQPKTINQVF
jgi:hypothetical protein